MPYPDNQITWPDDTIVPPDDFFALPDGKISPMTKSPGARHEAKTRLQEAHRPEIDAEAILGPLTAEQRQAATSIEQDTLIIAGPGTGKTTAIVRRLAYILASGAAGPDDILGLTFTNKAAGELKRRIADLTGIDTEAMAIGTFHGICNRLLREHHEKIGLAKDYVILDEDDQTNVVREILLEHGYPIAGRKKQPEHPKNIPPVKPSAVTNIISLLKDAGLTPNQVATENTSPTGADENETAVREIYAPYNKRLRDLNSLDFGDLLLETTLLLETNPELLEYYRGKWKHILVDEYQDCNIIQHRFLELLAARAILACVGDDDQSIYGWRKADVGKMLSFRERRRNAAVIRLTRNFRSTGRVLRAARGLIGKNTRRYEKNLWTDAGEGPEIRAAKFGNGWNEAEAVAQLAHEHHRNGTPWKDMAVLVRAHWINIEIEQQFLKSHIPYILASKTRFLDRQEIKDMLAYLRLVHRMTDDLAFERAASRPKRGLGPAKLEKLKDIARRRKTCLLAAALYPDAESLGPQTIQRLRELANLIDELHQAAANTPLDTMIMNLALRTGYLAMLAENEDDDNDRTSNIHLLADLARSFATIGEFLDHLQLESEIGYSYDKDAVRVSTIHAAKGLEFTTVFLPGWEKDVIPSRGAELEPTLLEEERRLAYVALTRAKKHIYLSWTRHRHDRDNEESPFLREIPALEWKPWR